MRKTNNPNKDSFARGSDYFAFVLGGVLTFFAGPPLYHSTIGFVAAYAATEFGDSWVWLFKILWMICCGVGAFGLCLMLLAITLRLGLAKLGDMLFRH